MAPTRKRSGDGLLRCGQFITVYMDGRVWREGKNIFCESHLKKCFLFSLRPGHSSGRYTTRRVIKILHVKEPTRIHGNEMAPCDAYVIMQNTTREIKYKIWRRRRRVIKIRSTPRVVLADRTPDPFIEILKRMDVVDFICSGAVCASWRSTAKTGDLNCWNIKRNQIPWLRPRQAPLSFLRRQSQLFQPTTSTEVLSSISPSS